MSSHAKSHKSHTKDSEKSTINQTTDDSNEPFPDFTLQYAKNLVDEMLNHKKLPSKRVTLGLIKWNYFYHKNLPNIVEINNLKNIIIVGDVHGQFHDVASIFNENGYPSEENPYFFNGDFVDRGTEGIEILLTLFAFKIACPNSIFLNRGNQFVLKKSDFFCFSPF